MICCNYIPYLRPFGSPGSKGSTWGVKGSYGAPLKGFGVDVRQVKS